MKYEHQMTMNYFSIFSLFFLFFLFFLLFLFIFFLPPFFTIAVIEKDLLCYVYILGLTLWNLSSFEFKFDDTRLSSKYKNKIGPIENFFCCILTLQNLCPVGCISLAETANRAETLQRQDATKNFWWGRSYFYMIRKVWYHQILIQNYLGFIPPVDLHWFFEISSVTG